MEIKLNNEALRPSTYSKFWKQTATPHHKLFSTFDLEKRQFQMAFLKPKVSAPRGVEDYSASISLVDTKHIHTIDHIDFHKKESEMIY